MKKLLTTAMVMVLGGLSVGYAAPTGTIPLTLNAQNICVVNPGAIVGSMTSNYTWSDALPVVMNLSFTGMVDCTQNAPSPTGSAVGTASVHLPYFKADDGGGRFLDYDITQSQINVQTQLGGDGVLAEPDVYKFDLEVTVPTGQEVPAGAYTDTINIDITP